MLAVLAAPVLGAPLGLWLLDASLSLVVPGDLIEGRPRWAWCTELLVGFCFLPCLALLSVARGAVPCVDASGEAAGGPEPFAAALAAHVTLRSASSAPGPPPLPRGPAARLCAGAAAAALVLAVPQQPCQGGQAAVLSAAAWVAGGSCRGLWLVWPRDAVAGLAYALGAPLSGLACSAAALCWAAGSGAGWAAGCAATAAALAACAGRQGRQLLECPLADCLWGSDDA
eukprot:TRINITY_DN37758_c0_g1_i2.p2 TRINITY_DN37758_c0_g1~~TRINITY_DN37758_c0_g1_i2.p2  ORF type:complete len:252 (+),score=56.61 TRINITY_DN37758_c0_g1_i2:75-758(+)